jgi:superfamily I DNA/RNA helicase
MLKKYFPAKQITFNFDNSFEKIFNHKKLSPEELLVEFNEFIWANNISKEDYVENVCDRIGMKNPIKKTDRALIWKSLEEAEEKLEKNKTWPRNFAAKKIIEKMKLAKENGDTDFCTEYSFVDEAQDLPPVILSLIKESTNQCVFLAGDSDQSIYRKGFSWNKSGIDIRGRTKILKTNFRNTNQIHEFAEAYRKNFKNMDKTTKPLAFRPGPPVELTISKNTNDLNQQLVQQVKLLLNILKYEEENICIIANQKQKLDKIKTLLESKLGVKSIQIADTDFDFAETKGIRLSTMQNCKGLDFPVVLFVADHRIQGAEELSCFDSETYYEQQYNMVYVCLTRAMEMLHIFTVETTEFSPFKDLTITN